MACRRRLAQVGHFFARNLFSVILGAATGLFMAVSSREITDWIWDRFDDAFPVWVNVSVTATGRTDTSVIFRAVGFKDRERCNLRRLWGQAFYAEQVVQEVNILRLDGRPIGRTLRRGWHTIEGLVAQPVRKDALALDLRSEHECAGRTIDALMGRIDLTPPP